MLCAYIVLCMSIFVGINQNCNVMEEDQVKNVSFTLGAIPVTPSDTVDLKVPGTVFIDQDGTEGNVHLGLLNGGEITVALMKDTPCALCPIVKRVYATGTTASGIKLNPLRVK